MSIDDKLELLAAGTRIVVGLSEDEHEVTITFRFGSCYDAMQYRDKLQHHLDQHANLTLHLKEVSSKEP